MIKNKENISELLDSVKNFSYYKDENEVDVVLKEKERINIRYYKEKCIIINFFDYNDGISTLYKDRKYINRKLSNKCKEKCLA